MINVENISKKYFINHSTSERYVSLAESVSNIFKKKRKNVNSEEFWALQDINFNINKGDRVGIIGRNGAGKSTLLKILSRITEPTTGKIKIQGRVSSLLEVGTGFHPELSGRENIFLNGAILGMSRNEINSKFDEIVSFAEIEKFIDTPVKRYSSGMYVRLAFAVAAHLEPEILIIDEVLAVGDIQFQKKCLGKMDDVSKKDGRTILFVSHNIGAVRSLCNRGILLKSGRIAHEGNISDTIDLYENSDEISQDGFWINQFSENDEAKFNSIHVLDKDFNPKSNFLNTDTINIQCEVEFYKDLEFVKVGFDLIKDGVVVFRVQQTDTLKDHKFYAKSKYRIVCEIPPHLLNHGTYFIRPLFSIHNVKLLLNIYDSVLKFQVELNKDDFFKIVLDDQNFPGLLYPKLNWSINQ